MKTLLRKLVPEKLVSLYHFALSELAGFWYRYPSRRMIVIGVTGTKGKSTTINLAGKMLEQADYKVGWVSSLSVKIGKEEKLNPWHITMPGRFMLQRLLRKMADGGCQYALIEVTSEGIKQWRHRGINFDAACFTGLAPEHLKAHGGYENYKKAKGKLFKSLAQSKRKHLVFSPYLDQTIPKVIVANRDDKEAKYFLGFNADKKFTFGLHREKKDIKEFDLCPSFFEVTPKGSKFRLNSTNFEVPLLGKFNLLNALAALAIARSQKIDFITIKKTLAKVEKMPGRMEFIDQGQNFEVIVDLAHTPDSFKAVLETVKGAYFVVSGFRNLICVFGSAGGGRDKWKRPKLGAIAEKYCDKIVLTNEDPYDENPRQIIAAIASGIKDKDKMLKIEDRREAIARGLSLAGKDDVVLVLGKGTEATMVIGNKKIPWDDRKVVREELSKLTS